MKILITGGHLTPAIALIEELQQRNLSTNSYQIVFVGRKFALEGEDTVSEEYKSIIARKIPFYSLTTGKLTRHFTKFTFISIVKIPLGLWQSFKIIQKEKPDIIMSFGGYIALPIALVAFPFRIPIITHEQTLTPGLANKIIAFFASKVCLSWPVNKKLSSKIIYTGNPVRKSIFVKDKPSFIKDLPDGKILYITGGNLGSHIINEVIAKSIRELLKEFVIIHQCGNSQIYQDFGTLSFIKEKLPPDLINKYYLLPYIPDNQVGWVMQKADLVIGRAGANTVTELLVLGKVSLLIPLPWAGGNEQEKNAQMLENLGTAEIISQSNFSPESLLATVSKIMNNLGKYQKKTLPNYQSIHLIAAKKIADVINDVYQKKSS